MSTNRPIDNKNTVVSIMIIMIRSTDSCLVTYKRLKLFVLRQITRMAINIFLYYFIEFKEEGRWVNIVKQTLIAKLCSNLLETGFQIMQPYHLARS